MRVGEKTGSEKKKVQLAASCTLKCAVIRISVRDLTNNETEKRIKLSLNGFVKRSILTVVLGMGHPLLKPDSFLAFYCGVRSEDTFIS